MELIPYVMYNGSCKKALEFYKEVFNGEIVHMSTFGESPMEVAEENKDRVMHASFAFGSSTIMASDSMPNQPSPETSNIHLSVDFKDVADMEEKFKKLAAGGKETMAIQDTFWGAKFGMLTDKFGINWMFNCDLEKK